MRIVDPNGEDVAIIHRCPSLVILRRKEGSGMPCPRKLLNGYRADTDVTSCRYWCVMLDADRYLGNTRCILMWYRYNADVITKWYSGALQSSGASLSAPGVERHSHLLSRFNRRCVHAVLSSVRSSSCSWVCCLLCSTIGEFSCFKEFILMFCRL